MQINDWKIQYRSILKGLFKDKNRIGILINRITDYENKTVKDDLEYIKYIDEKKKISVIYKRLNKNVFYLIIYQKEINLNLPYCILNYCMKIIQKQKKENIKKVNIIPIVIYFQEEKYICNKTIHPYFEMTTYDNHILELKYNLIDILNVSNIKKFNNTLLEELIYIENLK